MSTYGYSDSGTQAWMILDEVRTSAYAGAIAETVKAGDVVLDIGSGSGILALLAAKAGAKKVYAVEAGSAHELVRAHAKENGLGEVVDVVQANLRDVDPARFDPKPNVIIGEMLGHFAPQEYQHELYAIARDRLAAPDPRLIPGAYRLCFGLARIEELSRDIGSLRDTYGVSLEHLAQRLLSRPTFTRVKPESLLTPETATEWVASDAERPIHYDITVPIERTATANAVVVSWEAQLSPSHLLGSRAQDPETHWLQLALPLDRELPVEAGEQAQLVLSPRVLNDRSSWAWRVSVGDRMVGGDAMKAMIGKNDLATVAKRMGLQLASPERFEPKPTLLAWKAILEGDLTGSTVTSLAERLLDAKPGRYADLEDARQEVMGLLRQAGAL